VDIGPSVEATMIIVAKNTTLNPKYVLLFMSSRSLLLTSYLYIS